MKRLLLALIITLPMLKLNAQTLAQVYGVDSDQIAVFQESRKEMSKEEEEKLLSKLSKEMKAKLEEVKKLNKDKYQQMLRSFSQVSTFSLGYSKAEGVFGVSGLSET